MSRCAMNCCCRWSTRCRWTQSRTRGCKVAPAEVVLRLLLFKHVRNWNCHVLEREVLASFENRQFTHMGAGKAPDWLAA